MGKKTATYLERWSARTDNRIRFMNEILSGIQVIKMYAWEKSFMTMVANLRKKEMNAIRGYYSLRAILASLFTIARISILLTILALLYLGETITARKVFVIMSIFNHLNFTMVHFWPYCIGFFAECIVAMGRIQSFLEQSEQKFFDKSDEKLKKTVNKTMSNEKSDFLRKLDETKLNQNGGRRIENLTSNLKNLQMKNVSALWSEKDLNLGVFDINLDINPGQLFIVIGSVGCGKSSLLNAIIGELEIDSGTIEINGILSYGSQEPWLYDGSIKSNVTFIEEFDEKRYKEVCRVCALDRDFQLLPYGDSTIVGEKGVILSGGQKARVSLARAVYKNADIYLLDDPLSAVDAHVGQHIFEECICGFLKEKCVILVTHQLQFTKKINNIIVMESGRIISEGEYSEDRIANISRQQSENEENKVSSEDILIDTHEETFKLPDPDDDEEEFVRGKVGLNILKEYIFSTSTALVIFVLTLCVLDQIAVSGVDYFFSLYINWEESLASTTANLSESFNKTSVEEFSNFINGTNDTLTEYPANILNLTDINNKISINDIVLQRKTYIKTYIAFIIASVILVAIRHFSYFQFAIQASINLHNKLFSGIIRASMRFFHKNSSGRILNRFSRDVNTIDHALPLSANESSIVSSQNGFKFYLEVERFIFNF